MSEGQIGAIHYLTRQRINVSWRNGNFASVETSSDTVDSNVWIAPALFDVQVNGYGGIDFQQDKLTSDALISAARQLRRDGCAQFLLTLITDEWEKLLARLRFLKAIRDGNTELRHAIPGWHIEGPFLSEQPGFHGAHNPALMRNPTPGDIRQLKEIVGSDALLLTIAPERSGAVEAIRTATSLGIKVSLGHTNASLECLLEAVAAGASGFTHLGNGCPRELDRHDNILWRVFETRGLMAGIIPDAIHVSPAPFRIFHRALESIYYTTDAMSAAGAGPGRYKIGNLEVEVGSDQIVRQPGKTNFAGSALRPIDGIFRAAKMLDRPWQDVWSYFSTQPAKLMSMNRDLKIGHPANFCLLRFNKDNELIELKTFLHGVA